MNEDNIKIIIGDSSEPVDEILIPVEIVPEDIKREPLEIPITPFDFLKAQVMYTALKTDSLL